MGSRILFSICSKFCSFSGIEIFTGAADSIRCVNEFLWSLPKKRAELERFVRETGHPMDAALSRRNLLTRGIRLNDLVGREFSVGGIRMLGLRLCEPCTHLARLTGMPVLPGLVHRGGLYAQILEDGELSVGDPIVVNGEPLST